MLSGKDCLKWVPGTVLKSKGFRHDNDYISHQVPIGIYKSGASTIKPIRPCGLGKDPVLLLDFANCSSFCPGSNRRHGTSRASQHIILPRCVSIKAGQCGIMMQMTVFGHPGFLEIVTSHKKTLSSSLTQSGSWVIRVS